MTLGEKLRQARLEAGLSQRQLCGDQITRNMLSQIENGSANPSMATLQYLAQKLNKPVGFFLEDGFSDAGFPSCPALSEQHRLVQLWQAQPEDAPALAGALPAWDGALLLRAAAAIAEKDPERAAALLDAAQDHTSPGWYFVNGQLLAARKDWHGAADAFLQAESFHSAAVYGWLETCFRELEDYKAAYHYACKLRQLPQG